MHPLTPGQFFGSSSRNQGTCRRKKEQTNCPKTGPKLFCCKIWMFPFPCNLLFLNLDLGRPRLFTTNSCVFLSLLLGTQENKSVLCPDNCWNDCLTVVSCCPENLNYFYSLNSWPKAEDKCSWWPCGGVLGGRPHLMKNSPLMSSGVIRFSNKIHFAKAPNSYSKRAESMPRARQQWIQKIAIFSLNVHKWRQRKKNVVTKCPVIQPHPHWHLPIQNISRGMFRVGKGALKDKTSWNLSFRLNFENPTRFSCRLNRIRLPDWALFKVEGLILFCSMSHCRTAIPTDPGFQNGQWSGFIKRR